jgi:hypothetical protein
VWRWVRRISSGIETAVDRLSDVPVHDERIDIIERKIEEIVEALRPTNGDRRSISDRLDTVKQQTAANSEQIRDLRLRLDSTPEGASS